MKCPDVEPRNSWRGLGKGAFGPPSTSWIKPFARPRGLTTRAPSTGLWPNGGI